MPRFEDDFFYEATHPDTACRRTTCTDGSSTFRVVWYYIPWRVNPNRFKKQKAKEREPGVPYSSGGSNSGGRVLPGRVVGSSVRHRTKGQDFIRKF
ncbi:MAG: hypothetical protein JSW08_02900 [archaeon]|nr:MAG: hypothetical protein JSW08_02900 [archaeon]